MYFPDRKLVATFIFTLACTAVSFPQALPSKEPGSHSLKAGFENPPEAAQPRVWWHWMNGNVSREGIALDLKWMDSIGIGGFTVINAARDTPQVVEHRKVYMTPGWKKDFLYATKLGEKYGMEESIDSSPGWSETGGPWVPPSQGMKKYVWSKTVVEGGRPFTGKLAHPPANSGAFQDMGIDYNHPLPEGARPVPDYYADSLVIAYRQPETDVPLASLHPTMTASGGHPDFAMLTDGNLVKTTLIPVPQPGKAAWIEYSFPEATTIRSVTIVTSKPDWVAGRIWKTAPKKTLEASNDGETWRTVAQLDSAAGAVSFAPSPETTVSFPAVTAKYFRVAFYRMTPLQAAGLDPKPSEVQLEAKLKDYRIAELVLHPGARVNHFEEKAAFVPLINLYRYATPDFGAPDTVKQSDVINITSKMQPDGTLDWTPPPGRWVVLRFGYSLLGITNHPAPPEATGLEVDKLNGQYVHQYMEHFLDSYKSAVGPANMGKHGVRAVINDSWEAGSQNWTDNMIEEFRKLRGYDPIPWMPVLTGEIVGTPAESDGFLWDFRKTIADLIASEHYGVLTQVVHQWDMAHYCESHEGGRHFVADGMEVKKGCDVPMSAMWTQALGVNQILYNYNADDRESSSVAHIYGQNLVAAESMTASAAPWGWSPETLKPTADQEFINGVNRFFIHESTHQPLVDKKPGLTLGPFGQWFNRNETWANEAGPWVTYLARNSYMLQQGHFAADIIYFYGEDANLTGLYRARSPNLPAGYDFDYVNADALIHVLNVNSKGEISTPGGTTYRILGLARNSRYMSLPVLRALHQLVMEGATVAGEKPTDDPSLADSQIEFHRLDTELFGDGTGVHHVGKGTVYAGQTVAQALTAMRVMRDFDYNETESGAKLEFIHRNLVDGDLYFVDNRSDRDTQVKATFRVAGRVPLLWHSDTGKVEPVSFKITDGRTTVPLELGPWGAVFVVFREPTTKVLWTAPSKLEKQLATVQGPWKVAFPPNWGAPPSVTLTGLSSWSTNSITGVKYFSGTGTYSNTINAPASWFDHGAHIWLNLGEVKNLAEVSVNGKPAGIAWHAPYRVDITSALHPGKNDLSINVTNAWVNRLIGDEQPGVAKKYTFTTFRPYHADSPLLPSGLLGPVTLYSVTTE